MSQNVTLMCTFRYVYFPRYNDSKPPDMASSPPIPPSPFESNERMNDRGPRFKQTKGDGRYHHTVRRPLGHRRILQDDEISLIEWIWRDGLQIYEDQISGFVTNMTELLQLDPPEVEEMASVCGMGYAFRQRAVRAHQILRANNRDRIRRAQKGHWTVKRQGSVLLKIGAEGSLGIKDHLR